MYSLKYRSLVVAMVKDVEQAIVWLKRNSYIFDEKPCLFFYDVEAGQMVLRSLSYCAHHVGMDSRTFVRELLLHDGHPRIEFNYTLEKGEVL